MAFVKGRGVTVEVAATYDYAVNVTGVTQADPGVATATAHGMNDYTVGYFATVPGMAQLTGQACRVIDKVNDAFDLQGLNTTNYAAWGSNTVEFTPVATWATLAECDSYDIGGGAGDKIDETCLIDVVKKESQGNLPAQTVTLSIKSTDIPSSAMAIINSAAQSGGALTFRITTQGSTALRIFHGEPSLPGESVQTGQIGTGSLSVAVKGYVLFLEATPA